MINTQLSKFLALFFLLSAQALLADSQGSSEETHEIATSESLSAPSVDVRAAVPEPSTHLTLLAIGVAGLLLNRVCRVR